VTAEVEDAMLPLVVRPFDEESVVSLIGRQADALCAPFSAMLGHLGIRANFMLSDEHWARLTTALGVHPDVLSGMRRQPVVLGRQSGGIRMLGQTLRHHLVSHGALRICPTCLKEGRPMLERWDIAHAPICMRHGTELVDTCRCARSLSRRFRGSKISNSCPCGVPFSKLEARPARSGLIVMGRIVEAVLAGGDDAGLDAELSCLPLSDLLSVAHVVGVAAITPASEDRHVEPRGAVYGSVRVGADLADVTSIADLVEAAAPHLLSWSASYPDLLTRIACRNEAAGTRDADSVFATAIGRTLRRPPRINGIPLACMTQAVERFCEERFGIKPRKTSHRRDSPVGRKIAPHVTRRRIAETLGVGSQSPVLTRIFDEVVRSLDEEDAANSTGAKNLATRVERLVLRRWNSTHETLSLDEASRRLSHPRSTHSPEDWIHPNLLVPVDGAEQGVDGVLTRRRRGISFLTSDVEAMRDRIAGFAQVVASEEEMDGFVPFAQCRKFHGGGWPRKDFLLAFLAGRIPARSLIGRPHIADIWFERDVVRNLALEHRVQAVLAKDPFAIAYRCRSLVNEIWGRPAEHLSDYHLRHLRRIGGVRFVDVRNTTEDRDRPLYHYSMVDLLERAHLLQGPSVTLLVDDLLDAHRASRPSANRILVDEEQMAANIYLDDLAANACRSLPDRGGPAPDRSRYAVPPPGWRRGSSGSSYQGDIA
jgi:hypothetical protein